MTRRGLGPVARWLAGATLLAVATSLPPALVRAQDLPVGTIGGTVQDSTGRPLNDVQVLLLERQEIVRTRADGSFRFENLKPGRYRLGARAVGFRGVDVNVRLRDKKGEAVRITMPRLASRLPSVVTTAELGGISGVIADTALQPLGGITVKALGTSEDAKTDASGRFQLSVKPGRYMVRVQGKGYLDQLISVLVPPDSGRRVAVWLVPATKLSGAEIMRQRNLFDLDQRLSRVSTVSYRSFGREDLDKYGTWDVMTSMSRAIGQPLLDECARVNGGPEWRPLWTFALDEVEIVEADVQPGTRANSVNDGGRQLSRMPGSQTAGTYSNTQSPAAQCRFVVWTRR